MKSSKMKSPLKLVLFVTFALFMLWPATGMAFLTGETGSSFAITATHAHISTADGNSVPMWGYTLGSTMQYPGPTLIVAEDVAVSITLTNDLPEPVSMVFPGQTVTATGGVPGRLTREAPPGGTVTYTFTPNDPGTFMYHSGTRPDFQVQMGLQGALIVRPTGFVENDPATFTAYGDAATAFDHEYLFLHTDMDPEIHMQTEFLKLADIDTTSFHPVYWMLNGRTGPDTLAPGGAGWLPTQPYDAVARMHPGERVLVRMIGGGRDLHPFHTHGNNFEVIGKDGQRLLDATDGEIGWSDFTQTVVPGKTVDAIFTWTGAGMGWDIYGHTAEDGIVCTDVAPVDGFDDVTHESCADHELPFPVLLPDQLDLTFGQFYSGSPYLGAMGALPPGEGGFNAFGGYFFMWHSHNEKELTNDDIFPGGQMTMMIIEHPDVCIPQYAGQCDPVPAAVP